MADDDYDSPWNTWNGQQSFDSVADCNFDPTKSFTENGGDSLTALSSLLELKKQGHSVSLEDFLGVNSFKTAANASLASTLNAIENNSVFVKKDIKDIPVKDAAHLIAECFVKKGDLEKCRADLTPADFVVVVERAWDLVQEFSFGIYDENGGLRAMATIGDLVDLEHLSMEGLHPHIQNVFPYLEWITDKVMDQIPAADKRGVVLEKFMFGTSMENSPAENVFLMNMMEQEFHLRAEKAGYQASIAQNASPLTQQLAELLGCKRLLVNNPREYVNEKGEQPFIRCAVGTVITVDMMVYPTRK